MNSMKKIFVTGLFLTSTVILSAQTNIFPTNGNAGIGTTSPGYALDIRAGSVAIETGAGIFYRAGPYVTMGNSAYNNRPYISFNAVLTTSSGTNAFTPAYNAGSGLVLWGDAGGSGLHFLQRNYSNGTPPYDISTFTEAMTLSSSGYFGIGTAAPLTKLHLYNNSATLSNSNFITIDNRGANTSYTTTHVTGGILFAGYRDIRNPANIAGIWTVRTPAANGLASAGDLVFGASNNNGTNITTDNALPIERMRILSTGNIGISTANPVEKLSVNGTVLAKKVRVSQATADWPDYVFEPSYKLPSLASVEAFIKANKHLPDVPSAEEITNKGIDLGDNQTILLKKTEELTLYIIDQDKKLEQQNKLIMDQQLMLKQLLEELQKQKAEIAALKTATGN
jgi:hypothetical protein